MMRSAAVSVVATAMLVLAGIGPVGAAAGPSGIATAENTLASLSYGTATAKAGTDRVTSAWGANPLAEAAMDFLVAGAVKLSGGSVTATGPTESGSETLGTGAKTIEGLAGATVTGASVEAAVGAASASSSAVITMADLSLLNGLVSGTSARTATSSIVTAQSSTVERTLELGDVRVLSLRALLDRLGVDPTSLTCAGVAAAGAELGVDTAAACPSQDDVVAAVDALGAALSAARAQLVADLQTANATIAGLTIVTQPLIDLAARYGQDWSGLAGLLLSGAARDALIAQIDTRLTAVDGGISTAGTGTCAAAQQAASDVSASFPSMAAVLAPLSLAVADACAVLRSLLDDLMGVSLLGLDALTVGLNALARPDTPLAGGSGTIGAITVGNRSIAVAGLTSLSAALQLAIETAKAGTAGALTALGIGAFPEPEIEILGVESTAGRDQNDIWFAHVTVTGLHVALPPVPISLPSGTTLRAVLDAPVTPASAASRVRAAAPVATSPPIVVDVAVFSGEARYRASGPIDPVDPAPVPLNPGPGSGNPAPATGGPLPKTGSGLHWLAVGMAIMAAGAVVRFTLGEG
ncbi:MAG TPA: hypothetical protein VM841_10015 [Actinomycetota bacterium]|nr:hypothetical protein [Actinomycetota bacterium]